MDENELSFTFQLRGKPLEIARGAELALVSEIVFESPTSKDLKEVSQLKQALSRALMEVQDRSAGTAIEVDPDKVKDVTEITGEDIMSAVTISSEPLDELLEVGRKLLVSGVGKVEGIKFNSTMMQKVSCEELERMVGEYCRFFVMKRFLEN
jgi:hypothetical protein